jgi:hypothetical protein
MTKTDHRIFCPACGRAAIIALPVDRTVKVRCSECDALQHIIDGWTREDFTRWGVAWAPQPGWRQHLEAADWTGPPWDADARPR